MFLHKFVSGDLLFLAPLKGLCIFSRPRYLKQVFSVTQMTKNKVFFKSSGSFFFVASFGLKDQSQPRGENHV